MTDRHANDEFARLAQRFGKRLPHRLTAIVATIEQCDSAIESDAAFVEAARDVHRLAGSCGLYGFREHCDRLIEIEGLLDPAGRQGAAATDSAAIVAALRALASHETQ